MNVSTMNLTGLWGGFLLNRRLNAPPYVQFQNRTARFPNDTGSSRYTGDRVFLEFPWESNNT